MGSSVRVVMLSAFLSLSGWTGVAASGDARVEETLELDQTPAGYTLQFCDDCGVSGRQPHIPTNTSHTFPHESVSADVRARTVAYGTPHFDAEFEGLVDAVPYVLAITYASEKGNRRVQSLTAGGKSVHGPMVLPDGEAKRLLFRVPKGALHQRKLALHFACNEGHNAVVSVIELWAPLPERKVLNVEAVPSITGHISGTVLDLAFDGLPGAEISVLLDGRAIPITVTTDASGTFDMDASPHVKPGMEGSYRVVVRHEGIETEKDGYLSDLCFIEPSLTPVPTTTPGLKQNEIFLDGVWRIYPNPPQGFETSPTDGPGWSDFTVPGQWLQQGHDIPRDATVAVAVDFNVPESWRGMITHLRFEAVHGGANYWLNGQPIGSSQNLFTPVELDITRVARFGERNRLAMAMVVDTPSELMSFSSNYAFHSLGGIDRSVRVCALPPVHFADAYWDMRLESDHRDAVLSLHLVVANEDSQPARDLSVRVSVSGPTPHRGTLGKWNFALDEAVPGETKVQKEIHVPNPLKWSAEKPNLYRMSISLLRGGKEIERLERKIGFREITVHEGQLWVNGQKVKLAGVNRHEIDPLTGRAATAKHAFEDARLFKGANFNYIRTSHYPPTREFLDACDEIGLYVECEAPFCWTRAGRGEDDVHLDRDFLIPTAEMVREHRGHPSIILWSLANESGEGPGGKNALPKNFATTREYVRRVDSSRPVLFNNEWARDGGACDVAALHYPPWPPEGYEFVKDDPRPVLIDEYFPPQTFTQAETLRVNPGLDIVNWSTGQNGPSSFWSHVYASNRVIGGAIWAGIDEEFVLPGGKKVGYGVWGFLDVWRRPKSLWWDAKCLHSPVWIPVRHVKWSPGQRVVQIPVENRYAFTDLGELRVRWELGAKGGRCDASLAPGKTGILEVRLPKGVIEGDLLVLRFFEPGGALVTAHGVTLGAPIVPTPLSPTDGCPEWDQDERTITVKGQTFTLAVDRVTGDIHDDSIHLSSLPKLFVTRFEEKNVFNPGGASYAEFPDASTRVIDSITAEPRDGALAIVTRDRYAGYAGSTELLVDRDGQCRVSFDYVYSGEAFNAGEIGLRCEMDAACDEIQWRRRSEWDVYPRDHIGRPAGSAMATGSGGTDPIAARPAGPWYLDANEFGSRDFRATKYNIYESELRAPDGTGVRVDSDGTTDVRACLSSDGVNLHILNSRPVKDPCLPWPLGSPPVRIATGDRLQGHYAVRFLK